jgi:hypothetical protein
MAQRRGPAATGKKGKLDFTRATTVVRQANHRIAAQKMNRTSAAVREALLRQTPLLVRGVWKVTGDAVKPWFHLVDPLTRQPLPEDEVFQAWARQHRLQEKMRDALVDGHLHGDGYAELEWADTAPSISDVAPSAPLSDVHMVDPHGVDLELREDGRYDLVQTVHTATVRLHPDRYHVFPNRTLRGFVHGLSSVEVAYHVALSAVKGDQTIGEVLYHSGIPREHWTIEKGEQDDIDNLTRMINDPLFQRALVTDEKTKANVLNPSGVDPSNYHAWIKLSVAAVLGIPVMMLEGAQAGDVTGSETNIDQYHQDLELVRELNLRPGLERIIGGVTGLQTVDYEIQWNPFPIGAATQAVIARDRATAFSLLRANGLTVEAAAREAGLTLDPEADLEDATAPQAGRLPARAAVDDEPEQEAAAPVQRERNAA